MPSRRPPKTWTHTGDGVDLPCCVSIGHRRLPCGEQGYESVEISVAIWFRGLLRVRSVIYSSTQHICHPSRFFTTLLVTYQHFTQPTRTWGWSTFTNGLLTTLWRNWDFNFELITPSWLTSLLADTVTLFMPTSYLIKSLRCTAPLGHQGRSGAVIIASVYILFSNVSQLRLLCRVL